MQKRSWSNKEKLAVVIEGIKGQSLANICNEYQISQSVYYKWRDIFIDNAEKVFDASRASKKELLLVEENKKLKQAVGELTLELKKNSW